MKEGISIMKRRQNRRTNKTQSQGLTTIVAIIAVLMIGMVVWIGMNDWDISKAMNQVGIKDSETESPEASLSEEDAVLEGDDELEEPAEEEFPVEEIEPTPPKESTDSETEEKPFDGGYIEGQQLPSEPTYVNKILVANKKHPLPETFAPGEDKTARAAFNKMAAEAKLSGFNLTAFSTYRSYDYQVTLYNRYADRDGVEAADRYSARPGYSEHQTGLAFDIGEVNHEKHWASQSFGETEAGKWLLANAHRYGFILRYPNHKEEITGYMHEAWHYRYVGTPLSEEIFKKNITLEEYLGLE